MNYLNIATIRECTVSEGPGKRFAVWLQGCLKRCKGCCNIEMQELTSNKIISCEELINFIKLSKESNNIEGITLLGGEPILQSKGLSEVVEWCKNNNLSVMLFSGYLYGELRNSQDVYLKKLLSNTDILVDGEFKEELYDTNRSWVGSSNQVIHNLTDTYKDYDVFNDERKLEIIFEDDKILVNGWPFDID